mgnify:CR=1 FL=1
MMQHRHPLEKGISLTSILCYTIIGLNDERITTCRRNQVEATVSDRKGHGASEHKPGRSGSTDWRGADQHQSCDAGKDICERGLSAKDCREYRSRSRFKNSLEKIKDAA